MVSGGFDETLSSGGAADGRGEAETSGAEAGFAVLGIVALAETTGEADVVAGRAR
jgi:hypothetical protein